MKKLNLSICLSDIPANRITTTHAGKQYVNLTVLPRKEKGTFGETHTVSLTKRRSELSSTTVYVGRGEEVNAFFNNKNQ